MLGWGWASSIVSLSCNAAQLRTWMGPGERHQSWMAQMARMEV